VTRPLRLDITLAETCWEQVSALVLQRAWLGVCERCGLRPPTEAHHRWLRGQGGPDVPSNLASLCAECHKWCHAHPVAATEAGWIVQAPYDFRQVGLTLAGGMECLLDDLYGYEITGWAER
jgi:hypothetical protein